MKIRILFLLALSWGIASDALGGWTFAENSEGDTQTSYIQNNKMKFVAPDHIMIYDLDKNMICFANPKEKSFWSGTPEAFSAQAKKEMQQIHKTIDRQLAKVPAAQRETFRRSILRDIKKQAPAPPAKITVKATDQSAKVAGYTVKKYEIWMNDQIRQAYWIAKDVRVSSEFDVKRFGKMMRSFHTGPEQNSDEAIFSSPEVTDILRWGWPLRTVSYDEDGYPETTEVVRVKKTSLPDSVFQLPKDYQRIPVAALFGNYRHSEK